MKPIKTKNKLLPCLLILVVLAPLKLYSQVTGTFKVMGDSTKYYPVVFLDGGWWNDVATDLQIGRHNVHEDGQWRGAFISRFSFHTTNWGNGASFINAEIARGATWPFVSIRDFIGGWHDATSANGDMIILIWLRGGSNTYHYQSNYAVNPVVYDDVQNKLPFQEKNGSTYSLKSAVDPYVNINGATRSGDSYLNGTLQTKQVVVTQQGWADYVFDSTYDLLKLDKVDDFIRTNKHLPGFAAAGEISQHGLDLGGVVKQQQVKIEELTLYLIEQHKEKLALKKQLDEQAGILKDLQTQLHSLQSASKQ